MKPASSEHRNNASEATSSGSPILPMGWAPESLSYICRSRPGEVFFKKSVPRLFIGKGAEPYEFQSKALHRPARTNELHARIRASGLYEVFNAITLTLGSGARVGTSICSLFSVWRKVNCFPLASKRADITFAVSPYRSNTPAGQSKT